MPLLREGASCSAGRRRYSPCGVSLAHSHSSRACAADHVLQDFKALSTELLLTSSSSGSLEYALQQKQAQYGHGREQEREGTPVAVNDAQLL